MAHRSSHNRRRSSSDPFQDQLYVAPHVSYADTVQPPRSATLQGQNPPLKFSSKKTRHPNDSRDPRMLEAAVRDTVTVRALDQSPRSKIVRSHTASVPSPIVQPPTHHRAFSQESVTQAANIVEKARKASRPSKKGSTHADVIDRMDYSSGPMFHHDGPFDACAPSRNRHKNKAPMLAWSTSPTEELLDTGMNHIRPDRRISPVDNLSGRYDSPYPAFTFTETLYSRPDNKQVDRIAEVWGIHTPEPYEEFFSGGVTKPNGDGGAASAASSVRAGKEDFRSTALNSSRGIHGRDGRDIREQFKGQQDENVHSKRSVTRPNLPPPVPIILPETDHVSVGQSLPSPELSTPGIPKRTKSLMHRIRKMRDGPNVPVEAANASHFTDVSPSSSAENDSLTRGHIVEGRTSRSLHRSQNSFFGRFVRNTSAHGTSSISPASENSDHFVFVAEAKVNDKALPPPPSDEDPIMSSVEKESDYNDVLLATSGTSNSPGSNGLGRKASLLRKVKGVVRGGGK